LCEQALDLNQQLGNRHSEANTWDSLGYIHHQLRNHQRAGDCYGNAIEIFDHIGDRYEAAQTLVRIGDVFEDSAAVDAAREAWRAALSILEEMGHTDAAPVRIKLRRLLSHRA